MKKFLVSTFIVLLMISMMGCTDDRQTVKLQSEEEVLRYAASSFGAAKIVGTEKNDEKNSVTYTMQDTEYGFQYTITSYASEFSLDGSKTDLYFEESDDNFAKEYHRYIMSQISESDILDDTMSYNRAGRGTLLTIRSAGEKNPQEDAQKVIDLVKKVDGRKYFKDYCIAICDDNGYYLGSCDIENGTFTNRYEEYAEQMTYRFAVEVHGTTNDLSGIAYLHYEQVQYKDVERLNLEWLDGDGQTPDDWTTAYYFDYNGETYFMLDDLVFIKDAEGIEGNHYSSNYTSYWFSAE